MSDPAKYRSRDEVQAMREKSDPIEGLKKLILEGGHADESALKAIDRDVRDEVAAAADFALETPEPALAELHTDVLLGTY
jgi:pyruvate dehydrogenase E1 component alpha subunit